MSRARRSSTEGCGCLGCRDDAVTVIDHPHGERTVCGAHIDGYPILEWLVDRDQTRADAEEALELFDLPADIDLNGTHVRLTGSGNCSVVALTEYLRDTVDGPCIVILDEAEGLPDSRALDRLANVRHLSAVVIVHEPHRWQSRLSTEALSNRCVDATHAPLRKFGVDELADIIAAWAQAGHPSGVVDRRRAGG